MPGLFSSLFSSTKPRLKKGMQDQSTHELYQAACRLLAQQDHEQISVAQIAREADISVGAFYQRFPDKDAFLSMVVSHRLSRARDRMESELDPKRWQNRPANAVSQAIVETMMRNVHGRHGAGIFRAALKRGYADRTKLAPLLRYRTALADRAVALLAHRAKNVKKPEHAVRSAMQIAEATALDGLLHDKGTLQPGSRRMAAALSAMMLSVLGLSGELRAKPQLEDDEGMLDMPVEEVTAEPIPEPVSSLKPKAVRNPKAGSIKTITPTAAAPQKKEETEPPRRKRRVRLL